ncbi:hypothetical protein RHS04_04863 [Rhizoctonia solani]|uniref:Fungal-specific transcription factor domain protein n=1 Tax=Rhizoctonia solani TaxID=456999 RepID=A0A8H7LKG7_9AGAM|nr:hypothetical protein RHS04_04863 [Rhizoctonia solani]
MPAMHKCWKNLQLRVRGTVWRRDSSNQKDQTSTAVNKLFARSGTHHGDLPGSISSQASSSLPESDRRLIETPVMDNVISEAPALPIGSTLVVPDDGADYDPEGIRTLLFMAPTMDRNTPDNSLSFVLQCYSQWAIFSTFEPLEMVHRIRDNVIQRFASKDTRIKTILMANVLRGFPQELAIGGKSMSVLTYLAHEVQKSGRYYITKLHRPKIDEDKRNATRILDHAFEVVTLQLYTQPTIAFAKSFDEIAAIFRYACPDLPGKPVNLPKIMLGTDTSLQWFACMDITHGALTGKPTYFQYDVPFSLHLCEQTPSYQSFQSIYGIPNQIIMFFAWVNSLCETPRTGDSREMVAWAEEMLPQIKFTAGESGDPLLRLGRIAVQECWRFAAYIYLYMTLCRADAHDPRVVRAQRGLMRLIKGMKQGRNPDLFLAPMAIAGVVAWRDNDRAIIRRRYSSIRECSSQGTMLNECVMQLEDIWKRTREENRPAVWSDLRIAFRRVTGK